MPRTPRLLRPAALLSLLVLGACSAPTGSGDDPQVSDNLLVSSFAEAATVYPDRLELPLSGHEDLLQTTAGALFVGGPSTSNPGNPYGFLRRAKEAHADGDRVVITTDRAQLTDVFKGIAQLQIQDANRAPLGTLQAESWTKAIGGYLEAHAGTLVAGAVLSAVDPVKTSQKYNANVELASGSISYKPKVTSAMKVSSGELQSFHLGAEGKLTADADLEVTVAPEGSLETKKGGLLQPLRFSKPIAQFSPVHAVQWLGGVPVWETLEMSLVINCELAFNGAGDIKLHVHSVVDGDFGVDYTQESGLAAGDPSPTLDASGSTFEVVQSGSVDGRCALQPQVGIMVYDLTGPTLAVGPYAQVHVDEATRGWSVQPGVVAAAGVKFEFAKTQLLQENFDIFNAAIGDPFNGTY